MRNRTWNAAAPAASIDLLSQIQGCGTQLGQCPNRQGGADDPIDRAVQRAVAVECCPFELPGEKLATHLPAVALAVDQHLDLGDPAFLDDDSGGDGLGLADFIEDPGGLATRSPITDALRGISMTENALELMLVLFVEAQRPDLRDPAKVAV